MYDLTLHFYLLIYLGALSWQYIDNVLGSSIFKQYSIDQTDLSPLFMNPGIVFNLLPL